MSRTEIDEAQNEFGIDTSDTYFESDEDLQVDDIYDLEKLLEDIVKIEDLDVLDNIHSKLISQRRFKIELKKKLEQEISEMRDALNKERCLVKQLDQVISAEQQKTEDLQNRIKIKNLEYSKLQLDQMLLLEELETEAFEITQQIQNAPKCYENDSLLLKLQEVHNEVEEVFPDLQKHNEILYKAQEFFKKPIDTPIDDINQAIKVLADRLAEVSSQNKDLIKSVELAARGVK